MSETENGTSKAAKVKPKRCVVEYGHDGLTVEVTTMGGRVDTYCLRCLGRLIREASE